MRRHRFQHTFTQSIATLPLVSVAVAVVWILPDVCNLWLWGGLLAVAVMALLMVEWNNRFQLLRLRSNVTPVLFLLLMGIYPEVHPLTWQMLPVGAMLVAYFLLFRTYGVLRAQGEVFYAFFLLGLSTLVFSPLVVLAPFLCFSLNVQLRSLTFKSLMASCFGLLLPYWCVVPVLFLLGADVASLAENWCALFPRRLPDYTSFPPSLWVNYAALLLPLLLAVLHFLRTAYNDKIRTRQYHYFFIVQLLPLVLLLLLCPAHAALLLPLLVLNAAPLLGHYFALARGIDFGLKLFLMLVLVVGIFNFLDLWTLFFSL